MGEHAKRSPSGADWWGNCPGAPAFVESLGITREAGPAAEWGTLCHGIAEVAVKYVLGLGTEKPVFPDDDPAVKEMVEEYVNLLFGTSV